MFSTSPSFTRPSLSPLHRLRLQHWLARRSACNQHYSLILLHRSRTPRSLSPPSITPVPRSCAARANQAPSPESRLSANSNSTATRQSFRRPPTTQSLATLLPSPQPQSPSL